MILPVLWFEQCVPSSAIVVVAACLVSYRGNRYSAPYRYAGKSVLVREPLDSSRIRIFHQRELIAEHRLGTGKGGMIIEPAHYARLPRRERILTLTAPAATAELTPEPGVGLHHPVPVVELRSLAIYEEVAHVATV